MNTTINGGATNTDAGFRNNFLAVYSGFYYSSLNSRSNEGYYWSSTVSNANALIT